jgi:NADH dehydrogenase FAD-containing subunit
VKSTAVDECGHKHVSKQVVECHTQKAVKKVKRDEREREKDNFRCLANTEVTISELVWATNYDMNSLADEHIKSVQIGQRMVREWRTARARKRSI